MLAVTLYGIRDALYGVKQHLWYYSDSGYRGLATYASSVSFGQPEHCFLTVWTPKSLGQDLLMMTILEDSACSVTPTIQTKQLLA